ncbi:MAG: hypothetical protein II808_04450 [Clostridia bacterium]|nr:hypothetical protein [Clostridia bacterium]
MTRLRIKNFVNIDSFEADFDPRLAVIKGADAAAVIRAVGVVLKSRALMKGEPEIRAGTEVYAEITVSDRRFSVSARASPEQNGFDYAVSGDGGSEDFYGLIRQSPEEESIVFFPPLEKRGFSNRLGDYYAADVRYPNGLFSELTDGVGATQFFRALLRHHIKERDAAVPKGEAFSEYLCYLDLNRFWQRIEETIDLHHASWPLFIVGLRENGLPADCIYKAFSLGRQVFTDAAVPAIHPCGSQRTESEAVL